MAKPAVAVDEITIGISYEGGKASSGGCTTEAGVSTLDVSGIDVVAEVTTRDSGVHELRTVRLGGFWTADQAYFEFPGDQAFLWVSFFTRPTGIWMTGNLTAVSDALPGTYALFPTACGGEREFEAGDALLEPTAQAVLDWFNALDYENLVWQGPVRQPLVIQALTPVAKVCDGSTSASVGFPATFTFANGEMASAALPSTSSQLAGSLTLQHSPESNLVTHVTLSVGLPEPLPADVVLLDSGGCANIGDSVVVLEADVHAGASEVFELTSAKLNWACIVENP